MNIINGNDMFYVIATSDSTYLHYTPEGAKNTAWGDVFTAERFDTQEDAETFVKKVLDSECDYTIKSVVVNWTIR